MSNTYKVKVSNGSEFNISKDQISNLDAVQTSDSKHHILQDNTPYIAEITGSHFNEKKYSVKVNNNTYDVAISNALDGLISDMGFAVGASKQVNAIKAPMPGLILDINVNVGQEVKEDDPLLILEAMKMENSLRAIDNVKIKSILVEEGDNLMVDQTILEFED